MKVMQRAVAMAMVVVMTVLMMSGCSSSASGGKENKKAHGVKTVCVMVSDSSNNHPELRKEIMSKIESQLSKNKGIKLVNMIADADILYSVSFLPLPQLRQYIHEDYMSVSTSFVDFNIKGEFSNASFLWMNEIDKCVQANNDAFNKFLDSSNKFDKQHQ